MRRLLASLAVVAISAVAIAAPAGAVPPPTKINKWAGIGPKKVVIVGDSLTAYAANEYLELTHRRLTSSVSAVPGVGRMSWWLDMMPAVVAAQPDAVVIALGIQDAWDMTQWGYDPKVEAAWARAFEILKGQCVVWLLPQVWQPALGAMQMLTGRLVDLHLFAHPHVRLDARWRVFAKGNPWVLGPDGLHHSPAGELNYAWALFLAAHHRCGV